MEKFKCEQGQGGCRSRGSHGKTAGYCQQRGSVRRFKGELTPGQHNPSPSWALLESGAQRPRPRPPPATTMPRLGPAQGRGSLTVGQSRREPPGGLLLIPCKATGRQRAKCCRWYLLRARSRPRPCPSRLPRPALINANQVRPPL